MSAISIKRQSSWTFNTSETGGAGLGFIVGSGGAIALNAPDGVTKWIHYAGIGVGASAGIRKIPKIGAALKALPKIDKVAGWSEKANVNGAPASFWNHGSIFVMNGCSTDELTLDDFSGWCVFIDLGAGVIAGYAGFALLLNVNTLAMAALDTLELPFEWMADPHALIVSRGWNVGFQASAGISFSEGRVW